MPRMPAEPLPRIETPIVPRNSIAGRALVAVVAIMTFLASLTTGAVMLVQCGGERMAVGRRARGHDPGPSRRRAATSTPTSTRRRRSRARSPASPRCGPIRRRNPRKLLEPWLGSGLVARRSAGAAPDRGQARVRRRARSRAVAARCWPSRCRARRSTIIAAGSTACAPWPAPRSPPASCILILMIAATMLSVTFATRGAMATNRPVIEVLHFVGAKDGFIAGHFQRHFLLLGLQGGAHRRRRGDRAVRARRRRQPLVRRHRRRRPVRGPVRHVFDRRCRLCRGARRRSC